MRELNPAPPASAARAAPPAGRPAFRPLGGLRALDVTRSAAGGYCAKLLAELGAEVLRVPPPGGGPPREPLAGLAAVQAARDTWLHGDKRIETIGPGGVARPALWCARAGAWDWIVEDWRPSERAALGWEAWVAALPGRPIDLSVTDGGRDEAAPLNDARRLAEAGHGWADGSPATAAGCVASALGGLFAALGALLAWHARARGIPARHVEHAVLEGLAGLRQTALERGPLDGAGPAAAPDVIHACRDGHVAAPVAAATPPELLAALTGDAAFSIDPALADPARRARDPGPFRARLAGWFAAQPRDAAVARAQALQLPFGRVRPLREVLSDSHFAARGFWRTVQVKGLGPVTFPGAPYRIHLRHAPPAAPEKTAASALAGSESNPCGSAPAKAGASASGEALPLSGLRVLELSAAWAGPMVGRLLAEYGAEVARIEPPGTGSGATEGGWLERGAQQRGKASVALDLSAPAGRDVLRRLAGRADVLVENFRPGVFEAWGCGYDALAAGHPALIVLSLSGFGRGGPRSGWRALGATVEAEAGWAALAAGDQGAPRLLAEPLSDPAAALHGLVALLAALRQRERTGLGLHIDLSQAECALHMLGDRVALASAGADTADANGDGAGTDAGSPPAPHPRLVVRDLAALRAWPYLHARGAFLRIAHPEAGTLTHLRTPLAIEGVTPRRAPAARPGADTARVLNEWLGMNDEALAGLAAAGAIPAR